MLVDQAMLTVWQLSAYSINMSKRGVVSYIFRRSTSVKTVLSWSRKRTKWKWTLERFVVTVVGGVNKPWTLLSEENEPSMVNWRWKVTRALDTRNRAQRRFQRGGRTAMFVMVTSPFGQRQRRTTRGPAVPPSCYSNMMRSFISSSTNCTTIEMKHLSSFPVVYIILVIISSIFLSLFFLNKKFLTSWIYISEREKGISFAAQFDLGMTRLPYDWFFIWHWTSDSHD